MKRKETAAQYPEEERQVFSSDLKKKMTELCTPDRARKRVLDHKSDVLNGSLPQGPAAHPKNTEDPCIRG